MIPNYSSERGVSPVIGVILMVAITVILAAVIGAFVLGIGPDQDPAPSGTYQIGEIDEDHSIEVRNRGGDALDFDDITIRLSGDTDTNAAGSYTRDDGNAEGDAPAEADEYTSIETARSGEESQILFQAGQFDYDSNSATVDVVIVHEPSDSILREATVEVRNDN